MTTKPLHSPFGVLLRRARLVAGYSLRRLSAVLRDETGIELAASSLHFYETGELVHPPRPQVLAALAQVLDVPASEFIGSIFRMPAAWSTQQNADPASVGGV